MCQAVQETRQRSVLENLQRFMCRKVEIEITRGNFEAMLTFNEFRIETTKDESYIIIYDANGEQELSLELSKINIGVVDSNETCKRLCELQVDDMSIAISSDKVYCCHCKCEIDIPYETKWNISGYGNYDSFYDGEDINVELCDDCLKDLMGHTEGGEIHE